MFSWGSLGNTWVVSGAVEFLFLFVEFSGQISSSCHFFITTLPPFSVGWQPLGCVSSKVSELKVLARPQSSLLAGRCILNFFILGKEYSLFFVDAQNQHFLTGDSQLIAVSSRLLHARLKFQHRGTQVTWTHVLVCHALTFRSPRDKKIESYH